MKITLRAIEPQDIDFLYRIENLPNVWRVSWGDGPVSRQMLWHYINSYTADLYSDRQLRMMIEADGISVGTIDISDYDPRNARAMVGVAVDEEYKGKGIATEALKLIIETCGATYGMHQLGALIPKDNEASLRLFEKVGFRTCGCLKSWLRDGKSFTDVVVMQKML